MNWFQRTLAVVVAVALVASGCGGGDDDSSVTTIGLLSAALADTADASSFRVSVAVGMKWSIAGEELLAGIDENNPVAVGETSAEREYLRFNMSTLFESLLGFSIDGWDDLGFEMWFDQERIVADTSALQPLVDADPDVDLGPIAPGVFFIDLTGLEAGSSELMDAVAGSSTPDLKEMAERLPAALITIEQTSTNPPTFVGTTTSARLNEALGNDVEADARCEAASLGMASPEDIDEVAEAIVEFYETNTAEVVIELDDQGLLSVLWTKEDYSDFFLIIAEFQSFGDDVSEEERQEAVEVFESAELVLASRVAYEPDPDGEVPMPPPATEDRTKEWNEFLPECS